MDKESRLAEKVLREGQPPGGNEQRRASPVLGDVEKRERVSANSVDEAGTGSLPAVPAPDEALPPQPATIAAVAPAAANGGTRAWLQVLGSFCLYFNTWGKGFPTNSMPYLSIPLWHNIML
jgi:hypothetical protein